MCNARVARVLALAAVIALVAAPLRAALAQDLATLRGRLARARALEPNDSESVARRARMEGRAQAVAARPSRVAPPLAMSGVEGLVVGLRKANSDDATAIATAVSRAVTEFGGFDSARVRNIALLDRWALVYYTSLDTADQRLLAGREIVPLPEPSRSGDEHKGDASWRKAAIVSGIHAIGEVLTPRTVRTWAGALYVVWDPAVENAGVIRGMIGDPSVPASGCVAGVAASCAAFLGIDDGPDVLRRRFPSADARRLGVLVGRRDAARARQCGSGDERACYELLARYGPPSPSSEYQRQSMLFFVRDRFGAAALRGLLADTSTRMEVRLRRATGLAPAALAEAWRSWVFRTAHWEPVRAGVREAVPVVLLVGLLLTLAARSGRWRA